MIAPLSKRLALLREGLDHPQRPSRITQRPFDGDTGHLEHLAALDPRDKADPYALVDYAHDVLYESEVQADLFRYALPFCLRAWRDDVVGEDQRYGGGVEMLYLALARRLNELLTSDQWEAVSAFMRDGILEEIENQSGLAYSGSGARPYRWFYALAAFGVILPGVEELWRHWCALETVGSAVAAVQYVSCLMYGESDNPIFVPWTRDGGGGPPVLWEFAGHLYTHRWLDPNVRFLDGMLTEDTVRSVLTRAVARLDGELEEGVAARVLADLPQRADIVRSRCEELPRILARAQDPGDWIEWTI